MLIKRGLGQSENFFFILTLLIIQISYFSRDLNKTTDWWTGEQAMASSPGLLPEARGCPYLVLT